MMKLIARILITVVALVLLQFLAPYINITTAYMLITLWVVFFNLDACYTYMNRRYIKQYEQNIMMRNLYCKIPYFVIVAIIFLIEITTIYALTYLYYEPRMYVASMPDDIPLFFGLPIANFALVAIVFAVMHLQALYNSMRLVEKVSNERKEE